MNTLIKVGAGVVGLTGVATASYFIRDYQNTERIYKRINDRGMTLLNYNDDNKEWIKRWKEYVGKKNNIWKLSGYEQAKDNLDTVPQNFKDKCVSISSLAINGNESIIADIENYCTKSFKVSDLLSNESGVKLLKTEDSDDLWKGAWGKYVDENKKASNPLSIEGWKAHTTNDKNTLPKNYKTQCSSFQGQEVRSKREEKYLTVKSYCTQVS